MVSSPSRSSAPDEGPASAAGRGASRGSFRLRRLWPLAAIGLGLIAFFAFDLDRFVGFEMLRDHRENLLAWRDANYPLAVLALIAVYAALVALSVPGAVWISITGGFLFGTVAATVYVALGATLGAILLFLAARHALADYFHVKAGPWMRRMEEGFRADAFNYLLFLRLVPVFPFWLVNLVPALLGVRLPTFASATAIGILPGTFVFCLVGNGVGQVIAEGRMPDLGIIFEPVVLGPVAGLALLALVPVAVRRFRRGRR